MIVSLYKWKCHFCRIRNSLLLWIGDSCWNQHHKYEYMKQNWIAFENSSPIFKQCVIEEFWTCKTKFWNINAKHSHVIITQFPLLTCNVRIFVTNNEEHLASPVLPKLLLSFQPLKGSTNKHSMFGLKCFLFKKFRFPHIRENM